MLILDDLDFFYLNEWREKWKSELAVPFSPLFHGRELSVGTPGFVIYLWKSLWKSFSWSVRLSAWKFLFLCFHAVGKDFKDFWGFWVEWHEYCFNNVDGKIRMEE
jgi:hypothetical protein